MFTTDHIRLSALNGKIRAAIDGAFSKLSFWVVADVTSHSFRAAKNYHYFDLVEKDAFSNELVAKISGSAWGAASVKIAEWEIKTGQAFTNNIHVLINVSVDYHSVYGLRLQLNDIDPNFTLGELARQKQATLDRLVKENPGFIDRVGNEYLTKNKVLTLGRVIQRIALITSRNSAGGEDFKHTLENNHHGYLFFIDEYFSGVQGEHNAEELLSQIVAVFNSAKPYDAVIITRGGGAQTDLLIFDNYLIGKAIAKFPIPVFTGIGHQKNETIADLMAHTSLKTPTRAAEFIIAHNRAFEDQLLHFEKSMIIKSQQFMARYKEALAQIANAIGYSSKYILYNRFNDVKNSSGKLKIFYGNYLKHKNTALLHHQLMVSLMSPGNILKKGFAIVKQNNKIVHSADTITVGSEIDIILSGTQLTAGVKQKTEYDGRDINL